MEVSILAAAILVKENGILGKCQKKVINRGGTVIERAELMSIILKKNIDISMKRQ